LTAQPALAFFVFHVFFYCLRYNNNSANPNYQANGGFIAPVSAPPQQQQQNQHSLRYPNNRNPNNRYTRG
jgi:hypothetical protein